VEELTNSGYKPLIPPGRASHFGFEAEEFERLSPDQIAGFQAVWDIAANQALKLAALISEEEFNQTLSLVMQESVPLNLNGE